MDTATILSFLHEILFMLIVFAFFLFFALKFGRQTVTNIIFGLYLGLLISIEFPYFSVFLGGVHDPTTSSIIRLIVFGVFSLIATMLFHRILPREYDESMFEAFWKKFLLAAAGTVLVMAYSYHALPVTEIITPGTPIQFLFAAKSSFFWWLIAPLVVLFVV